MIFWLIGSSIGFTLLTLFSGIGGQSKVSGSGFELIKTEIASVLLIMLSVVSMVSGAISVYHLMKGERDGTEKVLKTFIVSALGCMLISLV